MLNKILSTLILFTLLFFVAGAFYVFELPPFNPGGPIINQSKEKPSPKEAEKLPEILNDNGIKRTKTYSDHMIGGANFKKNGYITLAITEYESAAALAPDNANPLIEIGKIHYEQQDFIKAKLSFTEALKIDPDNLTAQINLGKTLIADKKMEEAQGVFNSIKVHNQLSKYYQGIITAYSGDHEKAKKLLQDATNIGTDSRITQFAHGILNAYAEFDTNQAGQNIHLLTLLARSFNQAGEYEIAISMLYDVIKEKNDYRDAWILLGFAYLKKNKYQDAVDALTEAKKLDPTKPETLFYLGLGYYGLNDLKNSATNLELAKKNGFEPAVFIDQKLAEVYLQLKEYEKSAQYYERVVGTNNKDVYYYIKPIWLYIDKVKNPEKALDLANKALNAHPEHAMSYNLMGWVSISLDQLENARKFLDHARLINPNMDAIYLNYGHLFSKKKDIAKALENYKKAYELGKGNSISEVASEKYNELINKLPKINPKINNELKASIIKN